MSVLVSAFKLSKSFGAHELFNEITFSIEAGQKIGLIGPNGAGKSTLLRILSGKMTSESGTLSFSRQIRIGFLEQTPTFKPQDTIFSAILNDPIEDCDTEKVLLADELFSKFEFDRAGIDREALVAELSGGWKKKVALARELAQDPNLLLLDEPTNHLDLESILWIEEFLEKKKSLGLLTITHDRLFLQNTCDYIFELDRKNPDGLIRYDGSYAEFVEFKESLMQSQKDLESSRRNLLRRETEWLRRGAKARQTKQRARIEKAGEISKEVAVLKERNSRSRLNLDFGKVGHLPKKIIEATDISKSFGDRVLFKNFSTVVGPKSRIGLLGKNGSGKTTLIKTLLGQLAPDSGRVNTMDPLTVSYFEQHKEALDPDKSVLRTICPEGDYVHKGGQPIFARSYLSRFLFRNDQMDLPVGKISGGEQSRLLIAQLMLKQDPVLVLDEPTNDLDIETLEVLQETLNSFEGVLILVTHDRFFMDQVVNQIYALTERDGEILKFSDYFQWQEWSKNKNFKPMDPKKEENAGGGSSKGKARLSYIEQREFDGMEVVIQEAEGLLANLEAEIASPAVSQNYARLQELSQALESQKSKVEKLYIRWQELSDKKK